MFHKIESQDCRESFNELNEWEEEMNNDRYCKFTGRLFGDLGKVETEREFVEPSRLIDFDAIDAMEEDRLFGRGKMLLTSEIWDTED